MTPGIVQRARLIRLLRPGWSCSRRRAFALLGAMARIAVLAFVFQLSGAAHMLSDVLLDDDMTCVDEQAHRAQPGSTAPPCPTAQGLGHGQGFAPPAKDAVSLPPPEAAVKVHARAADASPRFMPPSCIERPPRV